MADHALDHAGIAWWSDCAGSQRAMAAMMKMGKLDIATLQKAYDGG